MSSFVKASGGITPNSADPGEEFPFLHTITVVDRVVSVDKPELVQNNIKTETVTLNLDSEWEGLSTVINIGNEQPVSVIWSGEPVVIPAELMTTVGSLDVSVVGYGDDGGIRAVTKQAQSVFNVVASGFVEGDEAVPDPTTILGQLIQAADNANTAADRFNQASDDIGDISNAASEVKGYADSAKTSENNAAASATAAQNAVDGFGLEVGTTTTGEPGTDAAVSIVKQGTKYTASFTIPRGADGQGGSGGLSTISHDTTLTGDGTSGSPLGLAARTFLTPTDITDLNTAMETGVYEMTTSPLNSPAGNSRGFLIVGKIFSVINFIVQLAVLSYTNGRQEPSLWTRNGVGGGSISWNPWHRVDVTDYVANATYQALETRVQALESNPSGGLSSVTHDSTLLGDGTSSNPLKLAKGTILTLNAVDRNVDDGKTFDLNDALEGFTRIVGLKKNLLNLPNLDYITGNYATGLMLTTTLGSGNKIQLWFDARTGKGKIHIRAYVQPGWTSWNTTSTQSDLNNYVPLSTYQALEARVQALEAKLANQ